MDTFTGGARSVKARSVDFTRIKSACPAHAERIIPELFPEGRREGGEWVALNPSRADNTLGSFRINLKTGAYYDHATPETHGTDLIALWALRHGCNQVDAAVALAGQMGVDPYKDEPDDGLTLEVYATAKGFPVEFLRDLGMATVKHPYRTRETSALSIPYKRRDGSILRCRIRQALHKAVSDEKVGKSKETRFVWGKSESKDTCLYGLDRLDALAKGATVFLVEGESDAQTDWLHGGNTLGVPGATMFNADRDDPHLKGLELIAIIDPDNGGMAFARSLMTSKNKKRIRAVKLQDFGFKDLSVLHMEAPDRYDEIRQAAIDHAVPLGEFVKEEAKAALEAARKAPAPVEEDDADDEEEDAYAIRKRGTYWTKLSLEGVSVQVPLANFSAKITGEVIEDDGVEVRKTYEMTARMGGKDLPPFEILASDFSAPGWVDRELPAEAYVYPSNAAEKRLRHAIKVTSSPIPKRSVYLHTGWRKINGVWVYLHGDGAIGERGLIPGVSVRFGADLDAYRLPAPPEGDDLARAVRASLDLLDMAPTGITIPSLGAVYRAPLGDAFYSIHLAGETGARKSELAARMQQHFGAGWSGRKLPASWKGTGNSIEGIAFTTKDTITVVDDFKYDSQKGDMAKQDKKADLIFRGVGNGAGTSRMRPDGSLRPVKPPRCLIYSTGEDVPSGHSMRSRMLILQIRRGDMDLDRLTEAQHKGGQGVFAQAMAGYLKWLAPRYEETRAHLKSETERLRAADGKYSHGRTGDAVTDLYVAWGVFLDFACEARAITEEGAADLHGDILKTLEGVGARQADEHKGSDPVDRFMEILRAVFSSHAAHAANKNGGSPDNATSWGWGKGDLGALSPCGPRIGWVDGDALYLQTTAAYAAVQSLAEREGGRLEMSKDTLFKRIHERGWLASTDKGHLQVRPTLEGKQMRVYHLSVKAVMDGDVTEATEDDDGEI
jgi:hypothetical protein